MHHGAPESPPSWSNPALMPAALPAVQALDWQRLSGRYPWAVLLAGLFNWGLLIGALVLVSYLLPLLVEHGQVPHWLWLALSYSWLLGPLALLSLLAGQWRVRVLRYAVRGHDLHFRGGLFWRYSSHLPFARIQHVGLTSGPLERALGLRELTVYSAGSSGADLQIPGLPADSAERLRQYIIDQAGLDDDAE